MADLNPNDLSHLSDDEFNALCPHDGHAPGLEPLSPAAQTVLDAFTGDNTIYGLHLMRPKLAAALRAAMDQVACDMPDDNAYAAGFYAALGEVDAIATELENHQ